MASLPLTTSPFAFFFSPSSPLLFKHSMNILHIPHHSKLDKTQNALQTLDEMPQLKTIHTHKPHFTKRIEKFDLGIRSNHNPNNLLNPLRLSLVHALSKFTHEGNLILGQNYHALAIKIGFVFDKFVATSLLGMYAKCGDVESAFQMFHGSPDLDIVFYNSLISCYVSNGLFDQALNLFVQARYIGIRPSEYTFSMLLSVCGSVLAIDEGKQLHGQIVKMQYLLNTVVGNALLTTYCKVGMMVEAELLFEEIPNRNHISWTAIMTGFYQQAYFEKALAKFFRMRHSGIEPNEYSFAVALAACGGVKNSNCGRMVHAQAIKSGVFSGAFVGTAIIDMYAEYGEMSDAERQLEEMGSVASDVSWNALVAGYVRNGKHEESMEAFCRMLSNGIKCDQFLYSNMLKVCSSLTLLSSGEQMHCQVIKHRYFSNLHVGSSLIEMYTKCGNLTDAESIFYRMPIRDVVSWNSIIKAYSQYGYPEQAMLVFRKMVEQGRRPTSATFLAVLSACSHSGLVQEGLECFESMIRDYGITPKETHYSCIVDLLGRAGQLEDAMDFINSLPMEPTASIWRPLLAACRCHNNLQMAKFIAELILETDPGDLTVYVTLSNMYAKVGKWGDVDKQRKLMALKETKKEPGCSWIEANNKLHKFYSRDTTHIETPKIYAKLGEIVKEMKNMGYVPDTSFAIYPNKEASKEEQVLHHSEKLAVCFGLINLPASKPVRIFKNLRVCGDCHLALKYISKITKRDIVLRDNYRFHYFKKGHCSCGDYW